MDPHGRIAMEQDWVTYPIDGEDGTRLVGINLALAKVAPDALRSLNILIFIPFKQPGDDGLGDSGERERIGKMEDALSEKIEGALGAVHFVSVRGGGGVSFGAYAKPGQAMSLENAAREAFAGYTIEFHSDSDAEWEAYWDLLPDNDTLREIADLHLVHFLEDQGDTLTTPRPVDHFAIFPERREAEHYAKMASRHEFETRVDESDDGSVTVVATREDPVDFESIHEVTSVLSNLAEEAGGEYDGWETRVEKGE
jgi:Regulator of ribonuclease activity B/Family of unknown function (DUF695)